MENKTDKMPEFLDFLTTAQQIELRDQQEALWQWEESRAQHKSEVFMYGDASFTLADPPQKPDWLPAALEAYNAAFNKRFDSVCEEEKLFEVF